MIMRNIVKPLRSKSLLLFVKLHVFHFLKLLSQCVVPENIHTPRQKGLENNAWVKGDSQRPKQLLKKFAEFSNWNFQSGGGCYKNPRFNLWCRYGYFMGLHNGCLY